jgi:hypothetical protein
MADTVKIDIQFTPQREKMLIIPDKIEVQQFSIVQWNLLGIDKYYFESDFFRRGLIFTIYFNGKSAFSWRRQFVQLHGNPRFVPLYPNRYIRLAEDVASEKGDYKYGIKVEGSESNETLFDEDPYLIVY